MASGKTVEMAEVEPEMLGAAGDLDAANHAGQLPAKACEGADDIGSIESPAPLLVRALPPLRAVAELAAILAFLYLCDRTDAVPKSKKVYDPPRFWAICGAIFFAAVFTVQKLKDAKPLQREQTDEWKGWMQIMFLLYHYFAEKEVYNAIRVYIAAYVWMTGYGNFSLYAKGKSFTLRRNLQMLFRLNFLGFCVCISLNNEYMLYYICAMHTLFTVIVEIMLYVMQEANKSAFGIYAKVSMTLIATVVLYDGPQIVFRLMFGTLPVVRQLFAFHDPLHPEFTDEMHEWHFRSGLDRFIWIFGMVCAHHFADVEALLTRLQDSAKLFSTVVVASMLVGVLWWYFVFRLDKFSYNAVHPFTSAVPIAVYLVLRNLTPTFRQHYLFLFAWLGRATLETYILQFHVWMRTTGINGSPKYLLDWVPGYFYVNLALATAVYLFLSVRLASLTIVIRDTLIPEGVRDLATIWACTAGIALASWSLSYAFAPGSLDL